MLDLLNTAFNLSNSSYWYPLIWMFAAGLILYKMPQKTELLEGRTVQRWYGFNAFLLVLPLVLWSGARTVVGDTGAYRRSFYGAPAYFEDLPIYAQSLSKDRTFYLTMAVIKCLGLRDPTYFFLLTASFQMLCMVYTFRHYSDNFWISIFLFVASTDYYSWMFNGMRQFIATTMIFAAFGLLVKRRYVLYTLVVVIAAQFHGSAYIMLPLSFIMQGRAMDRKVLLMIVGTALVIPFADRLMPAINSALKNTQYSDITSNEIWATDDGTHPIRVLIYSVPALVSLFGYRYIRSCRDRAMNMCVNAAIITMAIYLISAVTSGIYIGRLPIYTTFHGYMVLPWAIDQIFEKQTARLIKALMVVCYAGFYYYQMGITWELL